MDTERIADDEYKQLIDIYILTGGIVKAVWQKYGQKKKSRLYMQKELFQKRKHSKEY